MQHGADQQSLLHDLLALVGDRLISPVRPTTYPSIRWGWRSTICWPEGSWARSRSYPDRRRRVRAQASDERGGQAGGQAGRIGGAGKEVDKKTATRPLLLGSDGGTEGGRCDGTGHKGCRGRRCRQRCRRHDRAGQSPFRGGRSRRRRSLVPTGGRRRQHRGHAQPGLCAGRKGRPQGPRSGSVGPRRAAMSAPCPTSVRSSGEGRPGRGGGVGTARRPAAATPTPCPTSDCCWPKEETAGTPRCGTGAPPPWAIPGPCTISAACSRGGATSTGPRSGSGTRSMREHVEHDQPRTRAPGPGRPRPSQRLVPAGRGGRRPEGAAKSS